MVVAADGRERYPLLHLNLMVANLDRSIDFYRQWFGFTRGQRTYPDGTVFIRNGQAFDLALHPGIPPSPPAPTVHFGFRCETGDPVRVLRDQLPRAGVRITEETDDDDFVSVKCLDPDGYEIEVYWERSRG